MICDPYFSKVYNLENDAETDNILLVSRALNSPTRIEIIRMLNVKQMTLTDIANALNIPVSSASVHTKILLDAGLIQIDYSTKKKGHIKYHGYSIHKSIVINLREPFGHGDDSDPFVFKLPIGDYIDIKVGKRSGAATETADLYQGIGFCGAEFNSDRHATQILYTDEGYVTYAIPNGKLKSRDVERIELMLEICSEANGFNENYQSDISFFLNDKRICVYTAPGDFGARYGKYTPDWWYKESTKYGLLVTIAINDKGVWLNGELVNRSLTLRDLDLAAGNRILLRIEVEENAKHKGGFNLFGDKFGDYDIPIVFTAYMKKTKNKIA